MNLNVNMLTYELATILKNNAPVRDGSKHPGRRGGSPYPGNLKQNGIRFMVNGNKSECQVGAPDAPYAPYTETRSRRRGWQKRSNNELVARLKSLGLEVTRI